MTVLKWAGLLVAAVLALAVLQVLVVAFVDNKHVVLFNTFNSQFKPEYIDAFRTRVMERGARSFEHRCVRRGRMGQQLSTEELLQAVDATWPASSPR